MAAPKAGLGHQNLSAKPYPHINEGDVSAALPAQTQNARHFGMHADFLAQQMTRVHADVGYLTVAGVCRCTLVNAVSHRPLPPECKRNVKVCVLRLGGCPQSLSHGHGSEGVGEG